MKFHNPNNKMIGHQDGVGFDFKNVLQTLQMQLTGNRKFLLVKCHLCESTASVRMDVNKILQTLECTWCKAPQKIRKLASGKYKVKSQRGIEMVNGENRYWIERYD
jgi:hypothetical protein